LELNSGDAGPDTWARQGPAGSACGSTSPPSTGRPLSQLLACLGLIKPMPVLSLSYTRPVLGERFSLGTAAALLACCPASRHSPLATLLSAICYKQPAARSPQPAARSPQPRTACCLGRGPPWACLLMGASPRYSIGMSGPECGSALAQHLRTRGDDVFGLDLFGGGEAATTSSAKAAARSRTCFGPPWFLLPAG
jgi:hypothetical protein